MAITQAQVTLDEAPVIDKRLQCVSRVESGTGNTVLNELFCLIDPDDASSTSIAKILNANPAGTEYGLVVRNIPGTSLQHIDDNAGSLTIDAPAGTPVAVRLSDGAAFYDFLTSDLDSGAGTQTRVVVGIAAPASGGAIIIPGSVANGLLVDVSRVTGVVHIDDNTGSLTVDAPVGTPVYVRLSDGAANLIGQKTMANSLPVTIASDQSTLVVDIRRGQTLKFASISAAASGNNTIVAAGTNKLKVVSYVIVADGTVTAKFQSGAGGTDLTGAMALVANSGVAISGTPGSWLFETAAATLLNLSLSAAIGVRGHISYIEEV